MKVFISWSGDSSKAVAEALRDWLPCVIQAIKPWMSKADLKSGSRWGLELAKELSDTRVGLICLTPDNISEPWILFEAGALSKTLDSKTLVCTYLLGLNPADLSEPLGQFQATLANEAGTRKLLSDIDQMLEDKLPEEALERLFKALWPEFAAKLESAAHLRPVEEPPRGEREILEEILALVRQQARSGFEIQGQLSEMARVVLDKGYYTLVTSPYRQSSGVSMGSAVSNMLASPLFMPISNLRRAPSSSTSEPAQNEHPEDEKE